MTSNSDTVTAVRGKPFQRGQSGNPNGRPRGSRNVVTALAEALLNGEAEAIIRKVVDKALEGDSTAMRLALERMLPPQRHRTVTIDFEGEINTVGDAARASSAVVSACVSGELSSEEATRTIELIKTHVAIVQAADLEARLAAVEKLVQK